MLSFPDRHLAHPFGAAGFPTPFSTASGADIAPSPTFRRVLDAHRSRVFRPSPQLRPGVSPDPASASAAMLVPRRNSNFAPSAFALGEFSCPVQLLHIPAWLWTLPSTSPGHPSPACAFNFLPASIAARIVFPDWNCVSTQVARPMHRPLQPCDAAPGCPGSSISWLCWRVNLRFPAASCPSAAPADGSPSCLEAVPSGVPGDLASGRPAASILSALPAAILRVAPHLRSVCRAFRMVLRANPKADSHPTSSGCAADRSPGYPGSSICGWADDGSRKDSNFASSARPRMNLRFRSGVAHSRQTLDAVSISL